MSMEVITTGIIWLVLTFAIQWIWQLRRRRIRLFSAGLIAILIMIGYVMLCKGIVYWNMLH